MRAGRRRSRAPAAAPAARARYPGFRPARAAPARAAAPAPRRCSARAGSPGASGSPRCASCAACAAAAYRSPPTCRSPNCSRGTARPERCALPVGAAVRVGAQHAGRRGLGAGVPERAARRARRRARGERPPAPARRSRALFPEPAAALRARRRRRRCGSARRCAPSTKTADGFVLDADPERFSHVVLAVGPHQLDAAARAASPRSRRCGRASPRSTYEPIYTCYLQYPQDVSLPLPMIGFDGG